jgi:hypothetical protein
MNTMYTMSPKFVAMANASTIAQMSLKRYLPTEVVKTIMSYHEDHNKKLLDLMNSYTSLTEEFDRVSHMVMNIEITIGKTIRFKNGGTLCPTLKYMVKYFIERTQTTITNILHVNDGTGQVVKTGIYAIQMKQNKNNMTVNINTRI